MKRTLTLLLGVFFIGMGTAHFVVPDYYVRVVPPFLPAPLLLVYVSGLAEVAGGVGVLIDRTRRLAGIGLILLLVAVFPANIYMATDQVPLGPLQPAPWTQWARLPFQAVFIAWVWWTTQRRTPLQKQPAGT